MAEKKTNLKDAGSLPRNRRVKKNQFLPYGIIHVVVHLGHGIVDRVVVPFDFFSRCCVPGEVLKTKAA